MYASEGAEVSTRESDRVPAGVGKRYAVSENPRNHPAFSNGQSETRGRSGECGSSFAGRAMLHTDEAATIVDGIAVEDDGTLLIRFDKGPCSGERELFTACQQHSDATDSPELAGREKDGDHSTRII